MAVAIPLIADMVNYAMDQEGLNTTVLFETMAGKGTEVGRTFEELAEIISRVERKDHVGVCLDTCHVYDGGYDIVNDLDGVLKRFDQIVGLEKLKAVHLNDDKNPLGSHKDRHEKIGEGTIGTEAFARIINHPALRELPFFWKHLTNFRDIKRKLICCVLFGRRNKMNERIKIKVKQMLDRGAKGLLRFRTAFLFSLFLFLSFSAVWRTCPAKRALMNCFLFLWDIF